MTNRWFLVSKTPPCFCFRPRSIKFFIFIQFLFDFFIIIWKQLKICLKTPQKRNQTMISTNLMHEQQAFDTSSIHMIVFYFFFLQYLSTHSLSQSFILLLFILHELLTLFDHHNSHEIVLKQPVCFILFSRFVFFYKKCDE